MRKRVLIGLIGGWFQKAVQGSGKIRQGRSRLLMWATGAQSNLGNQGNRGDPASVLYQPRGKGPQVFIHQLLSALFESCSQHDYFHGYQDCPCLRAVDASSQRKPSGSHKSWTGARFDSENDEQKGVGPNSTCYSASYMHVVNSWGTGAHGVQRVCGGSGGQTCWHKAWSSLVLSLYLSQL